MTPKVSRRISRCERTKKILGISGIPTFYNYATAFLHLFINLFFFINQTLWIKDMKDFHAVTFFQRKAHKTNLNCLQVTSTSTRGLLWDTIPTILF
jgi:hypothetical protein